MKEKILKCFEDVMGDSNDAKVYFAPGRVNLIGEHTDYNGGHVFPCALSIGTYGAFKKRTDGKLRFFSMNFPDAGVIESSLEDMRPLEDHSWAAYQKGVLWALKEKGYKLENGFDVVIYGTIPNGSGLSSSASLEVLTGYAVKEMYNLDISGEDIAVTCQYAENNYMGVNCGIMDQFAVAMGKSDNAIFLDCATLGFEYAPMVLDGYKIIVTNSNVKHSLVDSEYNKRRCECEKGLLMLQKVINCKTLGDVSAEQLEQNKDAITDETIYKRVKHAVCENIRTIKALDALKRGDIIDFGDLMNASHLSLMNDYEVSCDEIDCLVEAAWDIPGVVGSRITGGGFGGCTVSIVRDDTVERFVKEVTDRYSERCGRNCDCYVISIGDGPHIVE